MTTKERILKALEDLPDDATIEEVLDRVHLLLKIERGIAEVEAGKTLTHEEVVEYMKRWLR